MGGFLPFYFHCSLLKRRCDPGGQQYVQKLGHVCGTLLYMSIHTHTKCENDYKRLNGLKNGPTCDIYMYIIYEKNRKIHSNSEVQSTNQLQ